MIFLLFVGGLASGWLYMSIQQAEKDRQIAAQEDAFDQTLSDAQALANAGDGSGASVIYDEAIKSTNDSYQKSILILSKATVYLNDGDYDQALTFAKEAETIDQNFIVVKVIAQIYEEKGDKAKAIEYYQKTIELIDESDPLASADREYYQSLINGLAGDNN